MASNDFGNSNQCKFHLSMSLADACPQIADDKMLNGATTLYKHLTIQLEKTDSVYS